jgi:hypothetical protein
LSFSQLQNKLDECDSIGFDSNAHNICYIRNGLRFRIRSDNNLKQAIQSLHDKSGTITLVYRDKLQSENTLLASAAAVVTEQE